MHENEPVAPDKSGVHAIIANLEQQLAALDRLGAHIAAAHLDAALQQLRVDLIREIN